MAFIVGIINIVSVILVILGIVPGVTLAWVYLGGVLLVILVAMIAQAGKR